jgi:hypothetical protein
MINAIRRHPWVMRAAVTTVVVGVVGVGVVLAEDLWVNVAYVDIRKGDSGAYPVLTRVNQGEKLTVVEREEDWVHVKYKEFDGWVSAGDLSDKQVSATSLAGLGDSSSSGAGSSMSTKGFTEGEYAAAKGFNEAPFKAWMAQYDVSSETSLVKPDAIKAFMAAGHVGPRSKRGLPPQATPPGSGNPLSPS